MISEWAGLLASGKIRGTVQVSDYLKLPRYQIEGRTAQDIAQDWKAVFEKYCKRTGPSISPGNFEKVSYAVSCGSKIPLFNQ